MTDTNMIKILRAVRLELNPEVAGPLKPEGALQIKLTHADVMEVEWPDGSTDVLGRTVRAPGSFDPETDPVGAIQWNRHGDFDKAVQINLERETALGALMSGPNVLVAEGQPVMEPGPDPSKLNRVRR